jgi:hypothetical protein
LLITSTARKIQDLSILSIIFMQHWGLLAGFQTILYVVDGAIIKLCLYGHGEQTDDATQGGNAGKGQHEFYFRIE